MKDVVFFQLYGNHV